ncbi:MAG: hypothetical protein K2Y33_15520, partial [Mycolicibacterium frederiksbergense]|nr:hypothetical protein [Mycolicibacterium frederiksbergense]
NLGAKVPNPDRHAAFVLKCFDPAAGGFADTPGGKPDVAVTSVGVMAAVEASVWQDIGAQTLGKLGEALNALLAAGREAGVLRGDIDSRDVILLSWFLAHVEDGEWAERTPRLLEVLLDGLAAR